MKQALIVFPDVGSMTRFILTNRVLGINTNPQTFTMNGLFTEKQITIAEGIFGARIVYTRLN